MKASPYASLIIFLCSIVLALGACSKQDDGLSQSESITEHEELFVPTQEAVSYRDDIEPLLETKCLACHGCYDAPCQLKFETPDGVERGAHELEVYDGSRTEKQALTRLGIDAHSKQGWRDLGFYSVIEKHEDQSPLMAQMLQLGKRYEFAHNTRLPEELDTGLARDNVCTNLEGMADYRENHPLGGMPFGTTNLNDQEYALFMNWLEQGAKVTQREVTLSQDEKKAIDAWEKWLNRPSKEQQLVSRWLYEHLYLARLYFSDLADNGTYFEIVRSHTPSGKEIEIINTRRPNDNPEKDMYYRLAPVNEAIVHKRHITFPLNHERLGEFQQLFFEKENWTLDKLPGYSHDERQNPFTTFAAIPAQARYQFMLNEAEYFTRTFIRGPVCRGQIATDVIRDQFWAFFLAPENDAFITDPKYQEEAAPYLALAGQNDKLTDAGAEWLEFNEMRNKYLKLREATYQKAQPKGPSLADVWNGDGSNQNALLTIFRHHDSASVEKGWIGAVPTTVWLMDYPLFERTYYQLVVNFDVFGNVAHQLQTRLYFDLIRNGAEQNFLRLMPPAARKPLLESWYQNLGKLKLDISYTDVDTQFNTAETFSTQSPKDELVLRAMDKFASINAMASDPINRCENNSCERPDAKKWVKQADSTLATIASQPVKHLPGLSHLPETTLLHVTHGKERTVYTLIRNRAHTNVAFLMGEESRYKPEEDTFTVYPGIIGSYPNFIFSIPAEELKSAVEQLSQTKEEDKFRALVAHWGVRRTHHEFWDILADIVEWHKEERPRQAGILDINRYENL